MSTLAKTATLPTRFLLRRFAWPLTALAIARAGRQQWQANLSRRERRQLVALLRASRGRPRKHLSGRQRSQLWRLLRAFGPGELVRTSAGIALPVPGLRRRRR